MSTAAAASGGYRDRVTSLRNDVNALDARAHHAVLDVYALDTRLHDTQARLESLHTEAARLRNQQTLLAQQLAATRHTLAVSQRALEAHLRTLYEQDQADPVAVVLGARSLDDAVTELDALSRVADQSRYVIDATTAAQSRLGRLRAKLAARRVQLGAAISSVQRATNELASARAERVSFIAHLRDAAQLKSQQIGELETAARNVERKAATLQATAQAAPAPAVPTTTGGTTPGAAGGTMTVVATGYSLFGHTSTGAPVGWGVVAVDPAVIPLGTRLTIPGYGEGVAADTGSGVSGGSIDLWFPTPAQARGWGRRTVTITLH